MFIIKIKYFLVKNSQLLININNNQIPIDEDRLSQISHLTKYFNKIINNNLLGTQIIFFLQIKKKYFKLLT